MKLTEYLAKHAIRPSHFAASLGVATSTVTRWIDGMPPTLDMMRHIAEATKGDVMPNDWMTP